MGVILQVSCLTVGAVAREFKFLYWNKCTVQVSDTNKGSENRFPPLKREDTDIGVRNVESGSIFLSGRV